MSFIDDVQILVAEDDYLVSELLCTMLNRIGCHDIIEAKNGAEAYELAMSESPDVILMDINMPKLNGIDASRKILREKPTPIVILTAHETNDLVQEASDAGVAAYLTKPVNASALERAIIIAMARFQDLQQITMLNDALADKNKELKLALEHIETLEGMLPVCSGCKKIRSEAGEWDSLENYLLSHTKAKPTHGLCPDCLENLYG